MTKAKKNVPDQEKIDHWLANAKYQLERIQHHWKSGFYDINNIAPQDVFNGDGRHCAGLARARFLNGDLIIAVRETFRDAALSSLRTFKIVYDSADELYRPDNKDYSSVSETSAIRGLNYSLMAVDFSLANELAGWCQERPDGYKMDPEVNDYTFGLKYTLQNEDEKAIAILKPRLEKYLKKPPKGGYKRNYHTLTTALLGILEKDEALFNEGLSMQLNSYKSAARGEEKNTPKEFICDHAVALANLGLHRGLNVTVENDLLPPGLLIEKTP